MNIYYFWLKGEYIYSCESKNHDNAKDKFKSEGFTDLDYDYLLCYNTKNQVYSGSKNN